jgi:hypothetical protein
MWEVLKRLKPIFGAPWLLMGDFNEALWSFEQFLIRKRCEWEMAEFREVLAQCDVFDDIGFTGVTWTFDNKQKGDRNVKVRHRADLIGSRRQDCIT